MGNRGSTPTTVNDTQPKIIKSWDEKRAEMIGEKLIQWIDMNLDTMLNQFNAKGVSKFKTSIVHISSDNREKMEELLFDKYKLLLDTDYYYCNGERRDIYVITIPDLRQRQKYEKEHPKKEEESKETQEIKEETNSKPKAPIWDVILLPNQNESREARHTPEAEEGSVI